MTFEQGLVVAGILLLVAGVLIYLEFLTMRDDEYMLGLYYPKETWDPWPEHVRTAVAETIRLGRDPEATLVAYRILARRTGEWGKQ